MSSLRSGLKVRSWRHWDLAAARSSQQRTFGTEVVSGHPSYVERDTHNRRRHRQLPGPIDEGCDGNAEGCASPALARASQAGTRNAAHPRYERACVYGVSVSAELMNRAISETSSRRFCGDIGYTPELARPETWDSE